MTSSSWTRELLEEIATENFADDVDINEEIISLLQGRPRADVEYFFREGGQLPPPPPPPPPPMFPPSVSFASSTVDELARAMQSSADVGLLEITDLLPPASTATGSAAVAEADRRAAARRRAHTRALPAQDRIATIL